jgi:hypothetical protein
MMETTLPKAIQMYGVERQKQGGGSNEVYRPRPQKPEMRIVG